MSISTEKYMERLVEILLNKQGLLQEILILTETQAQSIHEDGIDNLHKLIDEKQLKIEAIDKLDDEFNVYFQRLKTTLNISSLSQLDASIIPGAKQLKEVTGEILKLITSIGDIEKQNNKKGDELLSHLGGEIKKINQGKKVNTGYTPGKPNIASYFIDKKK